ncbi:MAG: hypothetical protein ABJN40_11490 [Sneathiella sp.]
MKLSSTSSKELQISHALDYPYPRPNHSYMLRGRNISPMPADFWPAGRYPVIACGSNASPDQLIRKFSMIETDPLYVTRATLKDFVCCYSAHITGYGSIPATICWREGYQTECHISWLTEAQLEHMHQTESVGHNYQFSRLEGVYLTCHHSGRIENTYAYISLSGHLILDENPVLLAGLETSPNTLPSLNQGSVQDMIRKRVFQGISSDDFILSNILDTKLRGDRTAKLGQYAEKFFCPFENTILPGRL